jgi:hypothetical protein
MLRALRAWLVVGCARRNVASGESVSECTIIALVGNNHPGLWQHWIDQSVLMGTHLSFCGEKKDNCAASATANRVQLGAYPALRAADETSESSFGQTGGCPMHLKMRAFDHRADWRPALSSMVGEDSAKISPRTRERTRCRAFYGAIDRTRVLPSLSVDVCYHKSSFRRATPVTII